jgi:two-component system response regulator NreC
MNPIKVLIVDDHEMVRTGLRHLLETESDIQVVGEASNGVDGLALAKKLRPDVAIFDVAMPKMGGLEAIGLMRQSLPQTKVVILSMFSKESFAHEALQAGASAYVLKGAPSSDLIKAIRSAQDGSYYFSQEVHARMINSYVNRSKNTNDEVGYQSLSDREKQVFRLLVEGNKTADIADILCISGKTVEKHRTSLSKKLEVSNPVEMMKYAIRIGLIDPDSW